MTTEVTNKNFQKEVMEASGKVLVDFYAAWCGPCRMLSPVLETLQESEGWNVCKIDIDQSPELARQYNIMTVPTLMLINNGEIENTISGLISKKEIMAMMSH